MYIKGEESNPMNKNELNNPKKLHIETKLKLLFTAISILCMLYAVYIGMLSSTSASLVNNCIFLLTVDTIIYYIISNSGLDDYAEVGV